jgi:transcriptional regulator with XRE-family HTH domain
MTSIYSREYKVFLKRLRQARIDAGLTQADAAARLKRPQSFVSKCESGERRVDVVELAKLASMYDKPLEYFLREAKRI